MSLAPGTHLGPYEILAAIGAGGMGEVYRARDTRLDRTVAVKILPDTFAIDAQLRDRFEREAKVISSLEHPNICALYDVGEAPNPESRVPNPTPIRFLVMQYLEGETLEQRLTKGALPWHQALRYAIEIADALDRAHRQGIVHRDLKPGNVMLTKSGAKVLDFGLAKVGAAGAAGLGASGLPTTPPNLTAQGAILGTFQYMAPEQLEGGEVDARSDIFAFGTVLYEMLTGRRAFEGKSQASLIASILTSTPAPISTTQPLTPPALDRIVTTCLAKEPDDRWQSASDLVRELKWIKDSSTSMTAVVPAFAGVQPHSRAGSLKLIAAAMAGAIAGASAVGIIVLMRGSFPGGEPAAVTRAFLDVVPASHLRSERRDDDIADGRPSRTAIALSPDGRTLVFSAVGDSQQQLYVRPLDRLEATPIEGTERGNNPFFSPDGTWVGFWAEGTVPGSGAIRKVGLTGGPPVPICDEGAIMGATWGSNDQIVFARADGLFKVSASGGTPERLTTLDVARAEASHRLPQWLPGTESVMFTVRRLGLPTSDDTQIWNLSLADGGRTMLVDGGADGRYVSSGHIAYMRQGTLSAVPFDISRMKVTGGAVALLANVMQAENMPNANLDSGAGQFAVSASGVLVYVPGGVYPDSERSLVWVSRSGATETIPAPSKFYLAPRLSPAGDQIASFTQGTNRQVWIYHSVRGTLAPLTSDGRNGWSIWAPDGKHIAFGSATGLFWKSTDTGGTPERLTEGRSPSPSSWSPDGNTLAFVQSDPKTGNDIWVLSLADRRARPLIQTNAAELFPEFSPDGRWLAYSSNHSGRAEVYVQPYPGPGAPQQISSDGGSGPSWSKERRELFYMAVLGRTPQAGGPTWRMMAVPYTADQKFVAGRAQMLFEGTFALSVPVRGYDVTADGKRFLMVKQKERPRADPNRIMLVHNWVEELKRRVPTGGT